MTTFSNKILYTKGQLDYRCLTLTSNQTETTFKFKDPIFNVISIEAVQGEIKTNDPDEWLDVRCKEIDKRIENGITSYDTSLVLTKSEVPFIKSHTSRFFAKPKDRLDSLTIIINRKLPTTGSTTLSSDWIIELELTSIRVATHADWRNIPDTEISKETSEVLGIEPEDPQELADASGFAKSPVAIKEKAELKQEERKKKKKIKKSKKEPMTEIQPASTGTSLESSIMTGSLGLLGIGSALALGIKLK